MGSSFLPFARRRGDRSVLIATDPLGGITFDIRLQTHAGDNIPLGLYKDLDGLVPAMLEGDVVASWYDELSDSGRLAAQGDAGRRPTLHFENGVPTLLFNGADDYLDFTYTKARPFTIFLNYKAITGNTGRSLSGTPDNWLLGSHSTGARWHFASGSVGAAGGTADTWYSLSAFDDVAASTYWSSGALVATSGAVGEFGTSLLLGGAGEALLGAVTCLMLTGTLTTVDRQRVENYIAGLNP